MKRQAGDGLLIITTGTMGAALGAISAQRYIPDQMLPWALVGTIAGLAFGFVACLMQSSRAHALTSQSRNRPAGVAITLLDGSSSPSPQPQQGARLPRQLWAGLWFDTNAHENFQLCDDAGAVPRSFENQRLDIHARSLLPAIPPWDDFASSWICGGGPRWHIGISPRARVDPHVCRVEWRCG